MGGKKKHNVSGSAEVDKTKGQSAAALRYQHADTPFSIGGSYSKKNNPIQNLPIPHNVETKEISLGMQKNGFFARAGVRSHEFKVPSANFSQKQSESFQSVGYKDGNFGIQGNFTNGSFNSVSTSFSMDL